MTMKAKGQQKARREAKFLLASLFVCAGPAAHSTLRVFQLLQAASINSRNARNEIWDQRSHLGSTGTADGLG